MPIYDTLEILDMLKKIDEAISESKAYSLSKPGTDPDPKEIELVSYLRDKGYVKATLMNVPKIYEVYEITPSGYDYMRTVLENAEREQMKRWRSFWTGVGTGILLLAAIITIIDGVRNLFFR